MSNVCLMARPETSSIAPFFIVGDVSRSVAFYELLGFSVTFQEPAVDPFFATVLRDGAMLLLKHVGAPALPNSKRHPDARWDAYVFAPDPDALGAEFEGRGVAFSAPVRDTHDGLRGFEVADPDGYVLFFGRPR